MNIFSLLWSKSASTIIAVVAGIVSIFGLVWKIRSSAKAEMKAEQQDQMLRSMRRADDAARVVDGVADDKLDDWMRDKGYVRD